MIAHGSDATDHAKEYLQNGADFVLVGEAEQSLVELCASILERRRAQRANSREFYTSTRRATWCRARSSHRGIRIGRT